jgi:hypothetical protein
MGPPGWKVGEGAAVRERGRRGPGIGTRGARGPMGHPEVRRHKEETRGKGNPQGKRHGEEPQRSRAQK